MSYEGESDACPTCGRTFKTRVPAGGDGTGVFVAKHRDKDTGEVCEGSYIIIAAFDSRVFGTPKGRPLP